MLLHSDSLLGYVRMLDMSSCACLSRTNCEFDCRSFEDLADMREQLVLVAFRHCKARRQSVAPRSCPNAKGFFAVSAVFHTTSIFALAHLSSDVTFPRMSRSASGLLNLQEPFFRINGPSLERLQLSSHHSSACRPR